MIKISLLKILELTENINKKKLHVVYDCTDYKIVDNFHAVHDNFIDSTKDKHTIFSNNMTKEKGELNNSCYEEKENKIVSDEHYTFELISERETKKPSVKNSTLGNYKHNKIESFNNTYFICSNLNMMDSLKETHDKKDISTFDKMLSKHGRTEFSPTYTHKK